MAHNSHNYGWQGRTSQPFHPPSMAMDQQPFSQPPISSVPGYHVGYNQPPPSTQSYYQPSAPAPQYLSSHPSMPQSRHHARSSPVPYSYPSSQVSSSPPTIQDQAFTSPPSSYLLNQPDYYLAQNSSFSSNPSSLGVNPPAQSLINPGTVYSSTESTPNAGSSDPEQQVRVISFRPKPQCWDHGCNGREFSTFSNLLRHQREKSGVVAKAECPSCGAVFTRTTARNIHVAQGKCKGGGRETSIE
ncbi:uncharacterized protein LDX57_005269 [Aspergillus melleus]|uniref:uncharacterized protein n=1 Tax=Aspergillus melleus TaxID=138277 RepID=UPI001E8E4198|nr:uncharacterized protein LDX57_005269 [Aspergillus melleus]KAH8427555.1 hypothetical protein LDX57_005269 [Aspergillus melleus]